MRGIRIGLLKERPVDLPERLADLGHHVFRQIVRDPRKIVRIERRRNANEPVAAGFAHQARADCWFEFDERFGCLRRLERVPHLQAVVLLEGLEHKSHVGGMHAAKDSLHVRGVLALLQLDGDAPLRPVLAARQRLEGAMVLEQRGNLRRGGMQVGGRSLLGHMLHRIYTDCSAFRIVLPTGAGDNCGRMADNPDLSDPALYINRELSWLAFNERVLAQAQSDAHPLLERVKFLAITANNLDEFFMVRVATLARQRRAGHEVAAPDGLTAGQSLPMVRARAETMLREIAGCWENTLRPMLLDEEIAIIEPSDYSPAIERFLEDYFTHRVCPVLTPLAFDPGHPVPVHVE